MPLKKIKKSPAFTIRQATGRDLPVIKRLAKAYGLLTDDLKAREFLVAVQKRRIAGFGRLKKHPRIWELGCLGVRPEDRKQGIGEALIAKLAARSPADVYVTTLIPAYYRKAGFRVAVRCPADLRRKAEYCSGCDPINCRIMVRKK